MNLLNIIDQNKKNAPQAQFKVMDIRNINFDNHYFEAIICLATLTYVDDIDCKKILDKFDKILKKEGLIVINIIEWLNEEKLLKSLSNLLAISNLLNYSDDDLNNYCIEKMNKTLNMISE